MSRALIADRLKIKTTSVDLGALPEGLLLGRSTEGVGPVEVIALGSGLALVGGVLQATAGGTSIVEIVQDDF